MFWLSFILSLSLKTTHNTNIHVPGWIRTPNPSQRSAVDPRLRPLGHWDRQNRTGELPACSAAPQGSAPPRASLFYWLQNTQHALAAFFKQDTSLSQFWRTCFSKRRNGPISHPLTAWWLMARDSRSLSDKCYDLLHFDMSTNIWEQVTSSFFRRYISAQPVSQFTIWTITTGVSFIVFLSASAVVGYAGARRLSMPQSCRCRGMGKRNTWSITML